MINRLTPLIALWLAAGTAGFSAVSPDHNDRKAYPLETYDELILNGAFEVFVHQGDREEVILEGPEDLIESIKVRQHGSRVVVGDKPYHQKWLKKITVNVYFRNIQKLEINGISRLECRTPISTDHLRLYCNGIRNVEFELHADDLVATFDGIGSTYLSGMAGTADIECAGVGNLYAADLKVEKLRFESAGIGKAEIHAVKELYVDATGIGSVRYTGNPEVKSINRGGIGSVRSMW